MIALLGLLSRLRAGAAGAATASGTLAPILLLASVVLAAWAFHAQLQNARNTAQAAASALTSATTAAALQREQSERQIAALQDTLRRHAEQQTALTGVQHAVAARLQSLQRDNRSLSLENDRLHRWSSARLPERVARLHASPTLTGTADYLAHMPARDALHHAADGTDH